MSASDWWLVPEIVVSRHNGLYGNLEDEIDYARAVRRLGAAAVRDLVYFHPGRPSLDPDPALDLSAITPDILALYRAHRRPVRFLPEDVVPEHRGDPRAPAVLAAASSAEACGYSE